MILNDWIEVFFKATKHTFLGFVEKEDLTLASRAS